ncbi:MAG: hypothetical protein OHK0029_06120 [Armatimonadaceae bacterium]
MKMIRRGSVLAMFLTLPLLAAVLAGCGDETPAENGPKATPNPAVLNSTPPPGMTVGPPGAERPVTQVNK